MPLLGQGALVIWHGIAPEADEDMIRWHNTEHIPERVSIPGFLRGRRYDTAHRPLEYLDFYETESVETIRSAPYLARLNEPTPWTSRVLPHFRNTVRLGCRVLASVGRGVGGVLLTVRLRPAPGEDAKLRAWLGGPGLATVREPAAEGRARSLAELGYARLRAGETAEAALLRPVYLRPPAIGPQQPAAS